MTPQGSKYLDLDTTPLFFSSYITGEKSEKIRNNYMPILLVKSLSVNKNGACQSGPKKVTMMNS